MLVLSATALIAALGVALLIAVQPPLLPKALLTDGSQLTIEALTFGDHERRVGSPVQQALHQLLPSHLRKKSGVSVYQGNPGSLTLWTRKSGTAGQASNLYVALAAEDGSDLGVANLIQYTQDVEYCEFKLFPRRQRTIRLRFYDLRPVPEARTGPGWEWHPVGEIALPNPASGSYPVWSPAPLPVTTRARELDVVLTGYDERATENDLSPLVPPKTRWYVPRLAVFMRGRMLRDWVPTLNSMEDATGNRWVSGLDLDLADKRWSVSFGASSPVDRVRFPTSSWNDENALTLGFRLTRTPEAAYSPRESWGFKGIAFPLPRRHLACKVPGRALDGAQMEPPQVYGPGAELPEAVALSPRNETVIIIRGAGANARELVGNLIRGNDDRGRPVKFELIAAARSNGELMDAFTVRCQPGARSFNCTYVLEAPRLVEILAPRPVKRN